VTNAAKYRPDGGRIDLRSKVQGNKVVISVEDNGVGMTSEFMKRAFDSFAQVEQTTDRTTGGLGLGLALVKSLVEMHCGTVACSSEGLGKGCCFIVELPQHQETSENAREGLINSVSRKSRSLESKGYEKNLRKSRINQRFPREALINSPAPVPAGAAT
jgi:DNA topoisomerase VI subunit B